MVGIIIIMILPRASTHLNAALSVYQNLIKCKIYKRMNKIVQYGSYWKLYDSKICSQKIQDSKD